MIEHVATGQLDALQEVVSTLAQTQTRAECLRLAVALGRERLGFDRIGIWILDTDPHCVRGTFGIDERGELRDEQQQRVTVDDDFLESFAGPGHMKVCPDIPLRNDNGEVIGQGSWAGTLLWNGVKSSGYISTDTLLRQTPLDQAQLDLLALYGAMLGQILTRRALEDEKQELLAAERRHAQELDALRATVAEIAGELELPKLLDSIAANAIELLEVACSDLCLYDEERGDLLVVASRNLVGYNDHRMALGEGGAGRVAQNSKLLRIEDYQAWEGCSDPYRHLGVRATLHAPLLEGETLRGVISVGATDPRRRFDATDERLIGLLAQQATVSLRNAAIFADISRRVAEMQVLAMTDALTEVYNRRYALEMARHELERSRRNGQPTALILLDVDHFKQVNDTYGHLSGDQVLRDVAQVCKAALRAVDVVGRYGGEEFVIVLPGTDGPGAELVAGRLRALVADHTVATENGLVHVTVSLGVACSDGRRDMRLEQLLEQSDRGLYAAKRSGRNRVVRLVVAQSEG
jgi:diguanylate cyclase (GGDEF)-like protein